VFHPAVENWFRATHGEPSEPQRRGWPQIRAGRHTLIAAPTGSGKTLSAFLAAIDDLVVSGLAGTLKDELRVLYVSPLKALSNDIEKNLRQPLAGIRAQLEALGLPPIEIRSVVRTGDTSAADRNQLRKSPPHILVTTPESLYILLTSEGGRRALASVRTVIVDEIHALITNKRGAHLALSLERLSALAEQPLVRIGLSATQKPIEEVARFLVGSAPSHDTQPQDEPADVAIVDCGHKRKMRLSIELPASPLEAVMSAEVWGEVYDRIAELVQQNTTTLVFVGNRRLSERLCAQLAERVGEQQVAAHHGSLSKETRLAAEQKLKAGQLKALVATASLELGIDIGAVDLVCQIGSTRSIARLLQRVGRAGHQLGGTPDGKLFPLSRNDLVECSALLDSVTRGELDAVVVPPAPLDILAQQVVAMAACESCDEDALFARVRRAYPYRELPRERFEAVLSMLADGYNTSRGRRSALIRRDAVTRQIQGRKAARLVALTNGGAIPDNTDYRVVLEPENTHVGSVGEDFAIESMGGDIFQLGNASWRILKVEPGLVRVADAQGQPPTIPFWLGEGPARSDELSISVSRLRNELAERLEDENADGSSLASALRWLIEERHFSEPAAQQLLDYLAAARRTLGTLPTQRRVVMERFFDEAQNTHLVIHSSFGARVNRAWGLALRKRFCRTFNFELQAAATEDAIILSLGPTHSFELCTVGGFLKSATAESVLIQALLDAPMFEIRWRHNATRSLATPRFQSGRKVPATLVRIRANDLLATAFPDQQACLENLPGEREIPDHPLVWQTIQDCLTEAMDCGAFLEVLRRIERGEIEVCYRDLTEPSPLAHEILNANPYAFLDPAPLEERRTQAVMTRRFFDPKSARDLGQLDGDAIERVRREAWPSFENADELSDALYLCGFYVQRELSERLAHTETTPAQAAALFDQLLQQGRATRLVLPSGEVLWAAAERLAQLLAACPGAQPRPELSLPAALSASVEPETAWRELMRARLESLGPVTLRALAAPLAAPGSDAALRHAEQALLALETQGSAMMGRFTPGCQEPEWCVRGLLARIHRYTLERLRREIEPVTTAVFVRFLFDWQGVSSDHRQLGQASLPAVLAQLEGFEASAGSWESALLPARVGDYDPAWLDGLCLSGQLLWGRAEPPMNAKALRSLATTPIVLAQRENWSWIVGARLPAAAEAPAPELSAPGRQIEEQLRRGPRFFHDLRRSVATSSELELALSELVAAGRISADSFSGMRGLLPSKKSGAARRQRAQRRAPAGLESAGRWSLLEALEPPPEDQLERWARLLLRRYGVVFRALLDRENAPPWRDLLREYRRLEARGEVRGGRFVQRHAGEQFALPEAVPLLRSLRRAAPDGREVCLSACDPLNLLGTLLPGERVTATPSNSLLFRAGLAIAALEGGKVRIFEEVDEAAASSIGDRLRRGPASAEAHGEAPLAARGRREARRPEAALPASLLRLGSRRAS
jgi:ATP-dependent Lhr-like helicase